MRLERGFIFEVWSRHTRLELWSFARKHVGA